MGDATLRTRCDRYAIAQTEVVVAVYVRAQQRRRAYRPILGIAAT